MLTEVQQQLKSIIQLVYKMLLVCFVALDYPKTDLIVAWSHSLIPSLMSTFKRLVPATRHSCKFITLVILNFDYVFSLFCYNMSHYKYRRLQVVIYSKHTTSSKILRLCVVKLLKKKETNKVWKMSEVDYHFYWEKSLHLFLSKFLSYCQLIIIVN